MFWNPFKLHDGTTIYVLALLIALVSPAIYGDVALGRPKAKPAFAFLVIPLVSWLLIATGVPLGAFLSGRRRGSTGRPRQSN